MSLHYALPNEKSSRWGRKGGSEGKGKPVSLRNRYADEGRRFLLLEHGPHGTSAAGVIDEVVNGNDCDDRDNDCNDPDLRNHNGTDDKRRGADGDRKSTRLNSSH